MNNITFHSKPFHIGNVEIPEIVVTKGILVRLYISHFLGHKAPFRFDITQQIINGFQQQDSHLPWAHNYRQNDFMEKIKPLTVQGYLLKTMKIDKYNALQIVDELAIDCKDRFEYLGATKKKALIIKAHFQKHDCILFDYYAIDLLGIKYLETIVNTEIEKGKSAIAFDVLEYKEATEPFANIQPILITR